MRKKILFIIGILDTGGVSKSMLSLLNVIDKDKYEVSLLMMNASGAFSNQIPTGVRVLSDSRLTALTSGFSGIKDLISFRKGIGFHPILGLFSLIRFLISFFDKSLSGVFLTRIFPKITDECFDLIVEYNGQQDLYYMVNKLQGKRKITFFHSDYRKWRYYEKADRKYFGKVDGIYTISEECVSALKEVFPEYTDKFHLMENISSPSLINKLADELIEPALTKQQHDFIIASLGYVSIGKGSELAVQVAKKLKEVGISFEWWFIGGVTNDWDYQGFVKKNGLEDNVKFLGVKANPYPYLKRADLYVHLSKFEGKSIALDEVKVLCKPVVVTNFSTVHDQFEDRLNASICEMTVEDATNKVTELIHNASLRQSYIDYLKQHIVDNSNEIEKIYSLLS
ncbi:glycosyltransferase [Prevotella melaninogenica]|uniref:glycosyltransferase n=1 Tax=Prevotella melaninogenica TaxID=28132 RepID=UPI001C603F62|nr:glycosyltransferase [Prevotella melaninogenica]MBW4734900.1 glycosyltransferase [Prevotella melaninogenica]MBW4737387.1 glycosyltransferase [Prevotella melaninogenica]